MPRPAKVWKRKDDKWYYATINGKQERLSPDYQEAQELFHKLRSDQKPRMARKLATTLEEACNAFLTYGKLTKAEKTYKNQLDYLQSFCDFVGKGKRIYDV